MRRKLRWKILLLTTLPLVVLTVAALWTVDRGVSRQLLRNIDADLRRSAAVLENRLSARGRELAVAGRVIAQDPKFFSVVALTERGGRFPAEVARVARDFNTITQADLFEIVDARGRVIAAAGRDASAAAARASMISAALAGSRASGVLPGADADWQATAMPVRAGGRMVGALLLGARVDGELARRLAALTQCEVTFVSAGRVTASTLERAEDREATRRALDRLDAPSAPPLRVRGRLHHYLTLARPLPASSPQLGQRFVLQRAVDSETAFLGRIHVQLAELGGLAALVALLAGLLIAERITAPVERLVRGAAEMERGNYDYPLEVKSRDEIGYLASRFRDMRQHQRAYVRELEDEARIKSEFIGVASRDLRAPISVIAGYHELMAERKLGDLSPRQSQALEAMGRSIDTLRRIADDATRIAQIATERLVLSRSDQDLRPLVEQAIAEAVDTAEGRRVEVHGQVDPELGPVRLDGPRMAKALSHLIANGIRFTPDGGRVVVRAVRSQGDLVIEVEDNGIGIAPEHQRRIFDRLAGGREALHHHSSSTLAFNSAGLGLGLSVARGIVEAHGGSLHLESTLGRGSTFSVRLPLHPAPRAGRAA